ncbi:MAG: hypothetical protein NT067_00665 [Candidatus Diapherotrites archaeon]|nr:hypothetical protein [Candidatus Diapherotrites archaeon]
MDLAVRIYGEKSYKRYLVIPAAVVLICLFLAFVFPGIEQGIDLKGGTLVVVGSKTQVDASAIESAVRSQFQLTDLKVIPFQGGVQVQYGANRALESAKTLLESAKSSVAGNEAQAMASCQSAIGSLKAFLEPEKTSFDSASSCIEFASEFYDSAAAKFDSQLQALLVSKIGQENIKEGGFTRTEISPALGQMFWSTAQLIFLMAIILIIIVVFVSFRAFVPSALVITCMVFDMLAGLAGMAIFHISFSLASISSLLMLIGYSIDTDIMLTARLTKRKFRNMTDNAADCFITGLTMTGTALGALIVMLVCSWFWNIDTMFSISAVLFCGLIGDIIFTWFMNAPLLMWHLERIAKKKAGK